MLATSKKPSIRVATFDGPATDPAIREVPWPHVPRKAAHHNGVIPLETLRLHRPVKGADARGERLGKATPSRRFMSSG